jgi:hypothetical protein
MITYQPDLTQRQTERETENPSERIKDYGDKKPSSYDKHKDETKKLGMYQEHDNERNRVKFE